MPVELLIPDGNDALYPQAQVRDDKGNLLATLDLSHAAGGVYTPPAAYVMPDEKYIKIIYITYTDSDHTTESDTYQRDMDIAVIAEWGISEARFILVNFNKKNTVVNNLITKYRPNDEFDVNVTRDGNDVPIEEAM